MRLRRALIALALAVGTPAAASPLGSGIDRGTFDTGVRPQDDFYRYVNGAWLRRTPIPADRARYGVFQILEDQAQVQLRAIIEEAASGKRPRGSDAQKVGDMFRSFMDEDGVNARRLRGLDAELERITRLRDSAEIADLVAHHFRIGANTLFGGWVGRDPGNTSEYIITLYQGGLGLPDRDFYLEDEARFVKARDAYLKYLRTLLVAAGSPQAAHMAPRILALETAIARNHWSKVESRDAQKTYNRYKLGRVGRLGKGLDLKRMFRAVGVPRGGALVLRQPEHFAGLGEIVASTPLPVWRDYFRVRLIDSFAPYLHRELVEAHFEFHGRALTGTESIRPRWKRGVEVVEKTLGEVLGRMYVARHFPPQAKRRAQALVAQLLAAYERSIRDLDWMGAETRAAALEKLARMRSKIGYPERWKDYAALEVRAGDLIGNVLRSNRVEYARQLAKLGQPIDPDEWLMTPQTVNAYYLPTANEVVFPAAILQPPFFDAEADDAVNYGAIGGAIGHEIGHAFDDQGSRYDGEGRLRNWWTDEDRERFEARTRQLVDQYGRYQPVPGHNMNGEQTLGENIGDLGGVSIAFKAYKHSLNGQPAPVIDGWTGNQRFFIGWAQAWRVKFRREELLRRLTTAVHAPGEFRCNGVLSNLPVFYETFEVERGDGMYRPPQARVRIW